MNNVITKIIFTLIWMVTFTTTTMAQGTPPAGTPCITLTVTKHATVQIGMKAATADTPVWVETATGNYTPVTAGTGWTDFVNYTANGTTIKVHGNLEKFDCSGNETNLTGLTFSSGLTNLQSLDCSYNSIAALDVSGLTNLIRLHCYNNSLTALDVSGLTNLQSLDCSDNSLTVLDVSGLTGLKSLYCFNNNFSTQAIDDIYCGLPQRTATDNAVIYPIFNSSSTNHAIVLATNKQNAIDKNWKMQYTSDNTNIPTTTGGYACGTPYAGTPCITLTVTDGATVRIDMKAATADTPVWVETAAGSYTLVTADTGWTGSVNYTATNTTIKVHGNLKGFICSGNTTNLIGLTFSSGLTNLTGLYCNYNSLKVLDVSGLTNLTTLCCYNNSLTVLDVSGLTNLEDLFCSNNSLTALNVSELTSLKTLYCYNNNFSTQAMNDIYCGLPQRTATDNAVIYSVFNSISTNHATVPATNKQNAIDKKWKVRYL